MPHQALDDFLAAIRTIHGRQSLRLEPWQHRLLEDAVNEQEVQKPDRLRALELRAQHNALTNAEAVELENLQGDHAALLAALNEPDPEPADDGTPTDYLPGQIDLGYNPRPLTRDEHLAFATMKRGGKPPTRWQRFVAWLRTGGRR